MASVETERDRDREQLRPTMEGRDYRGCLSQFLSVANADDAVLQAAAGDADVMVRVQAGPFGAYANVLVREARLGNAVDLDAEDLDTLIWALQRAQREMREADRVDPSPSVRPIMRVLPSGTRVPLRGGEAA